MTKNRTFAARHSLAVALAALLALPASAQHDHGSALPIVTIQGRDHTFVVPARVAAGWSTLEFKNTGKAPHHVQLVRLPSGWTRTSFLAKLKENEAATLAGVEMIGGVGLLLPGASQQVTLDLSQTGTYLALCFMTDEKGVTHLAQGMVSAFQVTGAATSTTTTPATSAKPPTADLKVKLVDFGFELPRGATITEGPQVWEVENAGPEGHEMLVFMLAPGKTMADVNAYLQKPEGLMPLVPMGGAQGVTSGRTSYVHLNLTPGEYVLLCAIPSPVKNGAPHVALGMLRPFKVVAKTATR